MCIRLLTVRLRLVLRCSTVLSFLMHEREREEREEGGEKRREREERRGGRGRGSGRGERREKREGEGEGEGVCSYTGLRVSKATEHCTP